MSSYHKEVVAALRKVSLEHPELPAPSYYNSEYPFIGSLPVPKQRRLIKNYSFSNESIEKQRAIWQDVWDEADLFEVLSQPLFFFSSRRKRLILDDWEVLRTFTKKVDNWVHGDLLASVYSELHERHHEQIYPELEKWNRSDNPWERRLSILTLFYYSSLRKSYVPFQLAAPLVTALIGDEHFYVQKAVGWTFRELHTAYPEETYPLLLEYASRLPPAGWYAATERLSKDEKSHLMERRMSERGRKLGGSPAP